MLDLSFVEIGLNQVQIGQLSAAKTYGLELAESIREFMQLVRQDTPVSVLHSSHSRCVEYENSRKRVEICGAQLFYKNCFLKLKVEK